MSPSDRKASLWIKKEDALQDLRDTADILKRLAHLLAFFPEYTFSGPLRKTITSTEADSDKPPRVEGAG